MSEPEQLDLRDWLAAPPPGIPGAAAREIGPAPATLPPLPVRLTRVDPSCNMRRVCRSALATSLLGEAGVARRPGRSGTGGQSRTGWYRQPPEAETALQALARAKGQQGYLP